jgi:hypothetical protein
MVNSFTGAIVSSSPDALDSPLPDGLDFFTMILFTVICSMNSILQSIYPAHIAKLNRIMVSFFAFLIFSIECVKSFLCSEYSEVVFQGTGMLQRSNFSTDGREF